MKVLVAEDDPVTLDMTTSLIQEWGYEVVTAGDGDAAWKIIQQDDAPLILIADWQMPGMEGDELCRQARSRHGGGPLYILLMTSKNTSMGDKVSGLVAGADDYFTKPVNVSELRARLQVGERVLKLQLELHRRVEELEQALAQVKQLRGLLPICAHCKRIRDDKNYWHSVENYVADHSSAEFTHGICPACLEEQIDNFKRKSQEKTKAAPSKSS
jgi:DNA-binding response OmpR family regulator